MQKNIEKIFSTYIFPTILVFLTIYLTEFLNVKVINTFFSESTNMFVNFFSKEFYLWQIVLSGILIFFILKIYSRAIKSKSKQEKKMLNAIKNGPKVFFLTLNGEIERKFKIKYKLSVQNEEYKFDTLIPYCENCKKEPIRMSLYDQVNFKCNCGSLIIDEIVQDIKSRVITEVEKYE